MSEPRWAHLPGPTRLRKWRDDLNLTQQEAANLIGVDLARYNSYERGRMRPSRDRSVKIERVTKSLVEPKHWIDPDAKRAS